MTNELATTNGTSVATKPTLNANANAELFKRVVLDADLSTLSSEQLVDLYKIVCTRVGLDPYRKPFDLLKLNGKLVMYANKECTAQLANIYSLSVKVTTPIIADGICTVIASVGRPDNSIVEDIGCVPTENLRGENLANAMMKTATKAKRRAILSACGLGMLDVSEAESIANAEVVEIEIPPQLNDGEDDVIATQLAAIEGCETAEGMTTIVNGMKALSEGIRAAVRPAIAKHTERLKLRWTKDGYITLHA